MQKAIYTVGVSSKRAITEILSKRKGTYPYGYLQKVAREVNCSREYVRQVAQELGLRASFQEKPKCIDCGKEISRRSLRCRECNCRARSIPNVQCDYCGKSFHITKYVEAHHKLHFCSEKCHGGWLAEHANRSNRKKGGSTITHCAYCGKEIRVINSRLREKNFCSHYCTSLYYCASRYRRRGRAKLS